MTLGFRETYKNEGILPQRAIIKNWWIYQRSQVGGVGVAFRFFVLSRHGVWKWDPEMSRLTDHAQRFTRRTSHASRNIRTIQLFGLKEIYFAHILKKSKRNKYNTPGPVYAVSLPHSSLRTVSPSTDAAGQNIVAILFIQRCCSSHVRFNGGFISTWTRSWGQHMHWRSGERERLF